MNFQVALRRTEAGARVVTYGTSPEAHVRVEVLENAVAGLRLSRVREYPTKYVSAISASVLPALSTSTASSGRARHAACRWQASP